MLQELNDKRFWGIAIILLLLAGWVVVMDAKMGIYKNERCYDLLKVGEESKLLNLSNKFIYCRVGWDGICRCLMPFGNGTLYYYNSQNWGFKILEMGD
jgi:hypothetical protein